MPVLRTGGTPRSGSGPQDRYQVLGEIARGGVGMVLHGRDRDLGRDVALKVLRPDLANQPALVERFLEEAQIGGQLQHPGIVPVYGLGLHEDGRPSIAMQLVRGRTLAERIADRADPAEDLPRLLGLFERVAQTMAYAHARGVVHRDLKPSNVMVGPFGEVLVVDWGLAKVLDSSGRPDTSEARAITTRRSGGDGTASEVGSVLGTPAYMPPEQARGRVDLVDERADVFGLGAILGEILTGSPPFLGSSRECQSLAVRGDLEGAFARLEASAGDPEVLDLARRCLAPEPEDRPRDAGPVAATIAGHLAAVEERARRAEVEAAEARAAEEEARARLARERLQAERARAHAVERRIEADRARAEEEGQRRRALWERGRRRRTVLLAAVLLLAVALGVGGWIWLDADARSRAERARGAGRGALARAASLEEKGRWGEALTAATEAVALGEEAGGELVDRAREVHSRLAAKKREADERAARAAEDDRILARLAAIRGTFDRRTDTARLNVEYGLAFRDLGIDVDGLDVETAASRLRARPRRAELAAFLDLWTLTRAALAEAVAWRRPLDVARAGDREDEALATIREAIRSRDVPALTRVAEEASEIGPGTALLVAASLQGWGADHALVLRFLERAVARHPSDHRLRHELSVVLTEGVPPDHDRAAAHATAAIALRPDDGWLHSWRGFVRLGQHRREDAESDYRAAIRRDPDRGLFRTNLAIALLRMNRVEEARAAIEPATRGDAVPSLTLTILGEIQLREGDVETAEGTMRDALIANEHAPSAWHGLGMVAAERGRFAEAAEAFRKSVDLDPRRVTTWVNLAATLADAGKTDEALETYREAIRRDPRDASAHYNLGVTLKKLGEHEAALAAARRALRLDPERGIHHALLGSVLFARGETERAEKLLARALELDGEIASAREDLGLAQLRTGRTDAAITSLREAIRLEPERATAHHNLAIALSQKGRAEDALAAVSRALRIDENRQPSHLLLGMLRLGRGDVTGAIEALRRAVELNEDDAMAQYLLGEALRRGGDPEGGWPHLQRALKLDPDLPPAHTAVGLVLRGRGDLRGARDALRRGQELAARDPNHDVHAGDALRDVERLLELEDAFDAVRLGEREPSSPHEAVLLARVARSRRLEALAARLFRSAFVEAPELADDLRAAYRYEAARSAVRAGSGEGADADDLDADARRAWRDQALTWLRADLAIRRRQLGSGREALISWARTSLRYWQRDPQVASVRERARLAALDRAERQAWQLLWDDVASALSEGR